MCVWAAIWGSSRVRRGSCYTDFRQVQHALAGPELMAGPVEADGACPGRREKNKRADKKDKRKKAAVAGIKDRDTGTIRARLCRRPPSCLVEFVESNIANDTQVFTDKNRAYNGLHIYETANHGDKECAGGKVASNG